MTGAGAKSVREHAPEASVCIDPYHVVQLANQALDEVRRSYWNELRFLGDQHAAKHFRARAGRCSRSWRRSPTSSRPRCPAEGRRRRGVARLHAQKATRGIFGAGGLSLQDVNPDRRLLSRLARCRLAPFVKHGKTIRKHRVELLVAIHLGTNPRPHRRLNNRVHLITRGALYARQLWSITDCATRPRRVGSGYSHRADLAVVGA